MLLLLDESDDCCCCWNVPDRHGAIAGSSRHNVCHGRVPGDGRDFRRRRDRGMSHGGTRGIGAVDHGHVTAVGAGAEIVGVERTELQRGDGSRFGRGGGNRGQHGPVPFRWRSGGQDGGRIQQEDRSVGHATGDNASGILLGTSSRVATPGNAGKPKTATATVAGYFSFQDRLFPRNRTNRVDFQFHTATTTSTIPTRGLKANAGVL